MGFVLSDYVSKYPPRPFLVFNLPEGPNGGTPAYPELAIEQIVDKDKPTLKEYVGKMTGDQRSLAAAPKQLQIDGYQAFEFAIKSTAIYDFEGGKSATGSTVTYEIAFGYEGALYHCTMDSGYPIDAKYVKIFDDFCSSVRAATQPGPNGPMRVDGVPVDGYVDSVSVAGIRDAIAAFKASDSRDPASLTVISKDEMHGYIPQRDLGWITVKRSIFVEPDHSQHLGWDAYGQGLPQFAEALRCIKAAQVVYVFPVTTPLKPHRDDKHMRLLDVQARSQLADLLGSKEDWLVGFNDLMYPNKEPTNVGFVFRNGKDELVLFFEHSDVVVGTFNGEYLSGTLNDLGGSPNEKLAKELEEWKDRFAQPELQAHE